MTGWLAASALLVLCIFLLVLYFRGKHRINRLYAQIQAFLRTASSPYYSVKDDHFSLLENAVADLENRILTEHQNTVTQSKKNADFVSDISHQLKTPLAALKLYCEMDESTCPNEHTAKQLTLIEHMETLIHSLLRLENLKADAYQLTFELHDMRQIILETWNDLHSLYPDKQFALSGQALLRCDRNWMSEALLNILKNSCEHTPENGSIRVVLERSETSVSISICDNGGGVPPEDIAMLFQRFFHSAQNTNKNSAGIGLAITREIIDKHHGTIFAENIADGLRILVCLPIVDGIQSYEIVS